MKKNIFDRDNLYAWCIVPFDKMNRSPKERIEMLKNLGLTSYGYDWREEHLASTKEEFKLAENNGIDIECVWMWIDANNDGIGKLGEQNIKILRNIEDSGFHTTIWLGFNENFFDDLNHEESVSKGAAMAEFLYRKAKAIGCTIAFYNHGGWLGEPENQIEIIEELGYDDIGIVYNFHHGHSQIERFPELLELMLPYLIAVNINGMNPDGPKILTIGSGKMDRIMLQSLYRSAYEGPIGILCHIEDRDAKEVLSENLEGLNQLSDFLVKNED